MAKIKAKDVTRAADLVAALAEIPKIRKQISGKRKPKYCDGYSLEIQSAEMKDGHGSGSSAYFYLDGPIALAVLDGAESRIRVELEKLGVRP